MQLDCQDSEVFFQGIGRVVEVVRLGHQIKDWIKMGAARAAVVGRVDDCMNAFSFKDHSGARCLDRYDEKNGMRPVVFLAELMRKPGILNGIAALVVGK